MDIQFKRLLNLTGTVLAIAGVFFVAIRFNTYSSELDFSSLSSVVWLGLIGFSLVYGAANSLLALGWRELLEFFGESRSRLWTIRIYGLTQLAKYVPGNIMHFAGRQAMGLSAGVKGWALAKASVWELGLLFFAGGLFSVLIIPQYVPGISELIASVGFVMILLSVVLGLKRYGTPTLARAFCCYFIFLCISGMIFVALYLVLSGEFILTVSQLVLFCGAFVVAWLVGMIAPGAPAGAGVREVVLIVLLQGVVLESDLLVAVLLSRLVTVSGDVLFFLFVYFPNLKLK